MGNHTKDNELRDRAHLLKVVRETEAELPGVEPFLTELEGAHAQAVVSVSRRRALAATAQEATLQSNKDLTASREAAMALRHYIRGVLGLRAEKLRLYGIKPLRQRAKKRPLICRLPS